MIDDRTSHLNLPLPHAENLLIDDVPRLRSALSGLDAAIAAQTASVDAAIAAQTASVDAAIGTEAAARSALAERVSAVEALVFAAL